MTTPSTEKPVLRDYTAADYHVLVQAAMCTGNALHNLCHALAEHGIRTPDSALPGSNPYTDLVFEEYTLLAIGHLDLIHHTTTKWLVLEYRPEGHDNYIIFGPTSYAACRLKIAQQRLKQPGAKLSITPDVFREFAQGKRGEA